MPLVATCWTEPDPADTGATLPGASPRQAAELQRIAKGKLSAQFALSQALKDVRLALQAADDNCFAAWVPAYEWPQAVDQRLGDQDLTGVILLLTQQGGSPWP